MAVMCVCVFRHRAINLFLKAYKDQWLGVESPGHDKLIEDITVYLFHFYRSTKLVSRAVIIIVSGADGRKRLWIQVNNLKAIRDRSYVSMRS